MCSRRDSHSDDVVGMVDSITVHRRKVSANEETIAAVSGSRFKSNSAKNQLNKDPWLAVNNSIEPKLTILECATTTGTTGLKWMPVA
jgi:hypothetical protein